jgi:AraC-like DNA-binding protein
MHEKLYNGVQNSKVNLLEKNIPSTVVSVLQSELSERQMISLLDNSPVCIKILDLDFNLQYMSPAGIKSLNIEDINSFYNKPYPFSFYPKSFRDAMSKSIDKAVKNSKIVKLEASIVDMQNNELWYHSTIVPVESENARCESVLIISIESTSHKKTAIELSKLKRLQENIGVQLLIDHSNQYLNMSFMTKATNIVLSNISDTNFDVNILAEHLCMSRSTLQRKLAKVSGITAAMFIRQTRLAKAHEFIINDAHRTLAETANAVGFKHPGHFVNLYKKHKLTTEDDKALSLNIHPLDIIDRNTNAIYDDILSKVLNALSLTLGIICQIDNDLYKIVAVISKSDMFVPGEVFRLQDTYCREVFENGKTVALTQFNGSSGLCKHPLYKHMPLEAYIGTPIYKNGNAWGTLNFSSKCIKDDAFKDEEISFIEGLAAHISTTI